MLYVLLNQNLNLNFSENKYPQILDEEYEYIYIIKKYLCMASVCNIT